MSCEPVERCASARASVTEPGRWKQAKTETNTCARSQGDRGHRDAGAARHSDRQARPCRPFLLRVRRRHRLAGGPPQSKQEWTGLATLSESHRGGDWHRKAAGLLVDVLQAGVERAVVCEHVLDVARAHHAAARFWVSCVLSGLCSIDAAVTRHRRGREGPRR
jgi:hypothetical protein